MSDAVATQTTTDDNALSINKGKGYQIALFPFNNAATNCYLTLMTFITYYIDGLVFALTMTSLAVVISTVVMAMRIFDGITDPILGSILDKAKTKLGRFRLFIIIGQGMLIASAILMFFFLRIDFIANGADWVKWTFFIIIYIIYVLGYTCQCACTRAGQNCITNDPGQRSQFIIWNMIGMIGSIVLINLVASGILPGIVKGIYTAGNGALGDGTLASYPSDGSWVTPDFYNILVPITIVLSLIYTTMALVAIWKKDRPEFWGIDAKAEKVKFSDYGKLLTGNNQIRWLVASAGVNKLASTIATSGTVFALLYGCMMCAYDSLFIPIYVLSFLFMAVFFMWGSKTAARKGQKRAIVQFTALAFLFYIGIVVMILMWDQNNPDTYLSLFTTENGFQLSVNIFTVFWLIFYGCGYGAYNVISEMCIPMIADCTDYELYRSGNYVPGIMGTIFSLIDKLVSSANQLIIALFTVTLLGLNGLPATDTAYVEGMDMSLLILFAIIPMCAWVVTLIAMRFYKLSGKNITEVQAVNAVRKAAIAGGMPKADALEMWKTIDQVPTEFLYKPKQRIDKKTGEVIEMKDNWFDKLYYNLYAKHEGVNEAEPASNAIAIPAEYAEAGKQAILAAAAEANAPLRAAKTDEV